MTPQEAKAKELVDKYTAEIGRSDFHVPEFITGVACANGSKAYKKILEEETNSLAKRCALIAVDEIISDYKVFNDKHKSFKVPLFWLSVKEAINKQISLP